MTSVIRPLLAISLLVSLISAPCWSSDRSANLREAISKIEIGRYDEAKPSLEQVLSRDESDPLGRLALGVAYLHTGKLSKAKGEFQRILSTNPDEWHAHYALGLIALMEFHPADAERQFAFVAKAPEAQADLASLRAYMAYVRGKSPASGLPGSGALGTETSGMAALKAGRRDEAKSLLLEVLKAPAPPGFGETRAPLPTFNSEQPITVPGGKFEWKPVERTDARVVSGTVTLNADANRISDVAFVSLYVDDSCTSVTNCSPFQFSWDTTASPNGLHHIKIEAKGNSGTLISSKSLWVKVSNAGSGTSTTGADDAELSAKLWDCIKLSPSRKLAHYNLGKLYMQSGDRENAIKELEYAVAVDPKFMDARSLLNKQRGWGTRYVEAWRGKPGSKMIALTFDDGPNERTAEMLEMLAKLKVPATFFVVGFRAELQPDLIKAMQAGGHEVENHTYTHPNLTTLNADEVELELSRNAAVIHSITGKEVKYFRPPGGHANAATKEAAGRQGFTGVFWTILCSPYEGSRYGSMADHVINTACDGAIVLMHNGEPAATSGLPKIVNTLRERGYKFVTLSELLASGVTPPRKPDKQ